MLKTYTACGFQYFSPAENKENAASEIWIQSQFHLIKL